MAIEQPITVRGAPRKRLAAWMRSTRTTQTRLAAQIECHETFVSHVLRGRRSPGLLIAAKIEVLTASWSEGPIRAAEWAASRADATGVLEHLAALASDDELTALAAIARLDAAAWARVRAWADARHGGAR